MKIAKKLFSLILLFVIAILAVSSFANALDAEIEWVKVEGDLLDKDDTNSLSLDRDSTIQVKVKITAIDGVVDGVGNPNDLDDVELNVKLAGYDHPNKVSETTDVFDLEDGVSKIKTLTLKLPGNMDEDMYKLRVRVEDRNSDTLEQTFQLKVDPVKHSIVIKDVDVDPSHEVIAGRSVRALVNLKNYGQKDEEDVKIEFEIPELGLEALPDYVDIEEDDNKVSEELYIRIPTCTKAGEYEGVVTVSYHDDDYVIEETVDVEVVESELCTKSGSAPAANNNEPVAANTQVTVGVAAQDVPKGEGGVIYPITFTNPSSDVKTYVVGVTGADEWATVKISPLQTVTIAGGETKSVYVYLSAKDSTSVGEKMFSVDIKDSTGAVVEQVALTANVVDLEGGDAEDKSSLKRGLEIVLIVLVIILIIVGLVIAFKKRSDDDDDDDDDELGGQTYY